MRSATRTVSIALLLILVAPMLIACGEDSATLAEPLDTDALAPATVASLATPTQTSGDIGEPSSPFNNAITPSVGTPLAESSSAASPEVSNTVESFDSSALPDAALNKKYQPNEAGRVPVFMYHNIVDDGVPRDGTVDSYMYRTPDQFWNDMLWLYEHDFYLTPMSDVINGTIDIPVGKHPVVFTFDDSTSLHLTLEKNDAGEWVPSPDCAVGIMEAFYEMYPGFGRGAYFATVPGNGFSWPAMEQNDLVTEKVEWLVANDYEIGNHTMLHLDLSAISPEEFRENVGYPIQWLDRQIGADHPQNVMRILTLPFGIYPEKEISPENHKMMIHGFQYEGEWYELDAVLTLNGGSTWSYFSKAWDPYRIPRVPIDSSVFPIMEEGLITGESYYYTSDGNPNTITVPRPAAQPDWAQVDKKRVAESGMTLVVYDPETGDILDNSHSSIREGYNPDCLASCAHSPNALSGRRHSHRKFHNGNRFDPKPE